MTSSDSSPKPRFRVALELGYNGSERFYYDRQRDVDKTCDFGTPTDVPFLINNPKIRGSLLTHAWFFCPLFDFADVAAGLPEVEAVLDALHHRAGDVIVKEHFLTRLDIFVENGIESSSVNLLGKKLATLVMVLEESLLLKLVAPSQGHRRFRLVSRDSTAAEGPWPQGDVISSEYASHMPGIAAMEPADWNQRDPELMYRKLGMIWSARSWRELRRVLCIEGENDCDFYISLPEKPIKVGDNKYLWDREHTWDWGWGTGNTVWFRFKYMQTAPEHELLRNWVEVIARVIEMALASPDEYKRCLEAIFRIQHEADQGAWEQLMEHVLKLGHRIPDWRDQLARYERGEIIAGVDGNGLLRKRMGPFYSQPLGTRYDCLFRDDKI